MIESNYEASFIFDMIKFKREGLFGSNTIKSNHEVSFVFDTIQLDDDASSFVSNTIEYDHNLSLTFDAIEFMIEFD